MPLLHDAPPDGLSTSHMRALLRAASGRHTATAAITDAERARRHGNGVDDVRAGFAEEGKNSSFGGCIRRPTGDLPGPTVPACAPRRRFATGLSVHSGQAKGEYPLLATPSI